MRRRRSRTLPTRRSNTNAHQNRTIFLRVRGIHVVADISDPLAPAVLFNHRTLVYIFPPSTAELFRLLALVQLWNALIGGDVGGVAGDLPQATEVLYLAYSHACSDIYNADDSVLL